MNFDCNFVCFDDWNTNFVEILRKNVCFFEKYIYKSILYPF